MAGMRAQTQIDNQPTGVGAGSRYIYAVHEIGAQGKTFVSRCRAGQVFVAVCRIASAGRGRKLDGGT